MSQALSQSSQGYLELLDNDEHGDEYWKDILNTPVDLLGHKLELLKSENAKNHIEIKKILSENINDCLASAASTRLLNQEIKSVRERLNLCLQEMPASKLEVNEPIAPKGDDHLDGLHESYKHAWLPFFDIFDIENLIKTAIKSENFEEVSKMLVWMRKIIKSYEGCKIAATLEVLLQRVKKNFISSQCFQIRKKDSQLLDNFFQLLKALDLSIKENKLDCEFFKNIFQRNFKILLAERKPLHSEDKFLIDILAIYYRSLDRSVRFLDSLYRNQPPAKSAWGNESVQVYTNILRKSTIDLIGRSAEHLHVIELMKFSPVGRKCGTSAVQSIWQQNLEEGLYPIIKKNVYIFLRKLRANLRMVKLTSDVRETVLEPTLKAEADADCLSKVDIFEIINFNYLASKTHITMSLPEPGEYKREKLLKKLNQHAKMFLLDELPAFVNKTLSDRLKNEEYLQFQKRCRNMYVLISGEENV